MAAGGAVQEGGTCAAKELMKARSTQFKGEWVGTVLGAGAACCPLGMQAGGPQGSPKEIPAGGCARVLGNPYILWGACSASYYSLPAGEAPPQPRILSSQGRSVKTRTPRAWKGFAAAMAAASASLAARRQNMPSPQSWASGVRKGPMNCSRPRR